MGGLGGNEKGIQLRFDCRGEKSEVSRQTKKTEKVEGFFGGDGVRVKNDAVRAPDLIPEHSRFFLDQFLAGVVFQFGQLSNHFDETI